MQVWIGKNLGRKLLGSVMFNARLWTLPQLLRNCPLVSPACQSGQAYSVMERTTTIQYKPSPQLIQELYAPGGWHSRARMAHDRSDVGLNDDSHQFGGLYTVNLGAMNAGTGKSGR